MSKMVDTMERQILRGKVLHICNEAEPLGAGTEVIAVIMKKQGYAVIKEDISVAYSYLSGKGLITIEAMRSEVLEISRDIAHIAPMGVDVLEGTKEIDGVILGG